MERIFEARVENLSQQGLGTVKDDKGRTYFARGVWPGDYARFRTTEERDERYQFAELIELLKASPERRDSPCPHFGVGKDLCYGCPWIIANPESQAKRKLHRLHYAFERIGLSKDIIEDLWQAPEEFSYRTRAQFKTDGHSLGYAGLRGEAIADITSCLILSKKMQEKLQSLRSQLPNETWQPSEGFSWNFLDIDEDEHPFILNRRRPFKQVHAFQNQRMRDWVARETKGDLILELFSGSGNFTEVLTRENRNIYAFEVGAEAVEELRAKNLSGVHPERRDLYKPRTLSDLKGPEYQTMVVNPPRAGLLILTRLAKLIPSLRSLIYISCDLSTFMTDLQKLRVQDFELKTVQPVDQMPQTPHLELLARFERTR